MTVTLTTHDTDRLDEDPLNTMAGTGRFGFARVALVSRDRPPLVGSPKVRYQRREYVPPAPCVRSKRSRLSTILRVGTLRKTNKASIVMA